MSPCSGHQTLLGPLGIKPYWDHWASYPTGITGHQTLLGPLGIKPYWDHWASNPTGTTGQKANPTGTTDDWAESEGFSVSANVSITFIKMKTEAQRKKAKKNISRKK
jgi:hypothetical protein